MVLRSWPGDEQAVDAAAHRGDGLDVYGSGLASRAHPLLILSPPKKAVSQHDLINRSHRGWIGKCQENDTSANDGTAATSFLSISDRDKDDVKRGAERGD